MKIIVEFESEDEFEAFRISGKKPRKGKGDKDEPETATGAATNTVTAPAPIQPPAAAPTFAPQAAPSPFGAAPAAGVAPTAAAFPAPVASGPAPEVLALVQKISEQVDKVIGMGQPADKVLDWFQKRSGAGAEQATMDQIKSVFLPRMSTEMLTDTAKLIGMSPEQIALALTPRQ